MGQNNTGKLLPGICAIDLSRIVDFGRDRLESRQNQHVEKGPGSPGIRDYHRPEAIGSKEPIGIAIGEMERREKTIDQASFIEEHHTPEQSRYKCGYHVWDQIESTNQA